MKRNKSILTSTIWAVKGNTSSRTKSLSAITLDISEQSDKKLFIAKVTVKFSVMRLSRCEWVSHTNSVQHTEQGCWKNKIWKHSTYCPEFHGRKGRIKYTKPVIVLLALKKWEEQFCSSHCDLWPCIFNINSGAHLWEQRELIGWAEKLPLLLLIDVGCNPLSFKSSYSNLNKINYVLSLQNIITVANINWFKNIWPLFEDLKNTRIIKCLTLFRKQRKICNIWRTVAPVFPSMKTSSILKFPIKSFNKNRINQKFAFLK